jgi:thiamine pyrophosphokinase
MPEHLVKFDEPVTLVGGAPVCRETLEALRPAAPRLVAADRAADRLAGWGLMPEAVIGDMDSIRDLAAWEAGPARVLRLAEQETTDFEKCLYATEAPFYLALGFLGRRIDHTLAVLHVALSYPGKRLVLVGEMEAVTLVPPERGLALELEPGAKVSLYPLVPVTGTLSEGLAWPVRGLQMAPGRMIGTSNAATAARVAIGADRPGLVAMVPKRFAGAMLRAVTAG